MTLEELLTIYIAKRLKSGSPNTIRLYHHSIKSFGKSLCKTPELADLTDDNIERHMWALVNAGGSPSSANKDHGQLTALWRFASHNRIMDTWPNVRPLKEVERVPLGWMPEELDRLYNAIEREGGFIGTTPARLWWKCLVNVLLETGERIGAVRPLLVEHIQGDYLVIPAHLRKGKTRDKLYALSKETLADLRQMISVSRSENLFPWDRCDSYIYNRYKAILSTDRRSAFHRLRRSTASIVKKFGGDPTAALDHASPRTTKRYLDARIIGETPTSDFIRRYRNG
jgi:integrase